MKTLLIAIICFFTIFANAQHEFNCYTQVNSHQIEKSKTLEDQLEEYISSIQIDPSSLLIEIPVVVHVVYNIDEAELQDIPDAQILEQIAILNRDFRALNDDKDSVPDIFSNLVTDMQIEFCLKEITRTSTTEYSFSYWSDGIKSDYTGGKSPWNTDRYLNIWICNLSGGMLGYAQFPELGADSTDGVVIDYMVVGEDTTTWNLMDQYAGRVLHHEVGHWLNLRHIWGDAYSCEATDFVDDTPPQKFLYRKCIEDTTTCGSRDLVMNYMDYVPTWCMRCFTQGQKLRAWASMALFRNEIFHNSCDDLIAISKIEELEIKIYSNSVSRHLDIEIPEPRNSVIVIIDNFGRTIYTERVSDSKVRVYLHNISNGVYHVVLKSPTGKILRKRSISFL